MKYSDYMGRMYNQRYINGSMLEGLNDHVRVKGKDVWYGTGKPYN